MQSTNASGSSAPLAMALADSFPTRPLRVARTGAPSPALMLVLGLLMVAGAIATLAGGVVNVLPDLAVRANPMTVQTSTADGSCETKRVVFTSCSVVLSYEVAGIPHEVQREYVWIGTAQEYSTEVMVAADRPELATASVALDKLTNRVLSILAGFAVFLGIGLATLRQWRIVRTVRVRYAKQTAQPLTPVVVDLGTVKDVRLRGRLHEFTVQVDGKSRKRAQLLSKAEGGAPFLVAPGRALAVRAAGAEAHPVLLDAGLTRLDLTDDERARLLTPSRPAAPTP